MEDMQIHLSQNEIVEALKQYIEGKGISLATKQVSISFTAGRKGTGLSAELQIQDMDIPGYTDAEDPVPAITVSKVVALVQESETPTAAASTEEVPVDAPSKTTSLFS